MAPQIYALCAMMAGACAFLLLRGYRRTGHRILFWSGLCFIGLTTNNVLLMIDRELLPGVDLVMWRLTAGIGAMLLLLYGLINEEN